MISGKIFRYLILGVIATVLICIVLFIRSCNDRHLFGAGSGLGSVTRIENYKYSQRYYEKYADSFLVKFPEYRVPHDDPSGYMTSGYEFLNMAKFYFAEAPREIYCVQWQGIDVRMVYNVDSNKPVIENLVHNIRVPEAEKIRMRQRLATEVIQKIDSMIAASPERDSALLRPY